MKQNLNSKMVIHSLTFLQRVRRPPKSSCVIRCDNPEFSFRFLSLIPVTLTELAPLLSSHLPVQLLPMANDPTRPAAQDPDPTSSSRHYLDIIMSEDVPMMEVSLVSQPLTGGGGI